MKQKRMMTSHMRRIVSIRKRGQITLPVVMRKKLHLETNKKVEVSYWNNEIIIKPIKVTLEEAIGSFTLPEGKTLDDLMRQAEEESAQHLLCADVIS